MLEFLQNAKVLITGHTGFKGSWLSIILRDRCKELLGLSLPLSNENQFFIDLGIEKQMKSEYVNLMNYDHVEQVIKEF